ncbi:hypothetical protein D3C72_1267600 [compost metagenome]
MVHATELKAPLSSHHPGDCLETTSRLLLSKFQRIGLVFLRFQNLLTEGLEARRLEGIESCSNPPSAQPHHANGEACVGRGFVYARTLPVATRPPHHELLDVGIEALWPRHPAGHSQAVFERPLARFSPFQPANGAARRWPAPDQRSIRLLSPYASERRIDRPLAGLVQTQSIELPQNKQSKFRTGVQRPDGGRVIFTLGGKPPSRARSFLWPPGQSTSCISPKHPQHIRCAVAVIIFDLKRFECFLMEEQHDAVGQQLIENDWRPIEQPALTFLELDRHLTPSRAGEDGQGCHR